MASEQPILRSLFSASATMTELLPLLMRIISPPLKPVSLPCESGVSSEVDDQTAELAEAMFQEHPLQCKRRGQSQDVVGETPFSLMRKLISIGRGTLTFCGRFGRPMVLVI